MSKDIYLRGYVITRAIIFVGCYIYAIYEYGFLWGLGLGWLPSLIAATLGAFLWPLAALILTGIVALILINQIPNNTPVHRYKSNDLNQSEISERERRKLMQENFSTLANKKHIESINGILSSPIPELPEKWHYENKPIPSQCLDFFADTTQPMELNKCLNEPHNKKFKYTYLGDLDSGSIFLIENPTDGSGQFSSVEQMERRGNKIIHKEMIAGGDRCNGGILSARVSEDAIYYEQMVTPYDIIRLADTNDYSAEEDLINQYLANGDTQKYLSESEMLSQKEAFGIRAYEDIETSAASCFGRAKFRNKELLAITLNNDLRTYSFRNEWTSRYRYQQCFNRYAESMVNSGNADLSPLELRVFVDHFRRGCTLFKGDSYN